MTSEQIQATVQRFCLEYGFENAAPKDPNEAKVKQAIELTSKLNIGDTHTAAFLDMAYTEAKAKGQTEPTLQLDPENAKGSIVGYVSFYDYYLLLEKFETLRKSESFTLDIGSMGGSAFAGLSIRNLLQAMTAAGTSVYTNIHGVAASAAGLVFLGAPKANRKIPKGALFMSHNASAYLLWYSNRAGLKKYYNNVDTALQYLDNIIIDILNDELKMDEKDIRAKIEGGEDWYMDAKEAAALGLIQPENPGPHSKPKKGYSNEADMDGLFAALRETADAYNLKLADLAEPENDKIVGPGPNGTTVVVPVKPMGSKPESEGDTGAAAPPLKHRSCEDLYADFAGVA